MIGLGVAVHFVFRPKDISAEGGLMEASETKAEKRYVEREWVCLGERVTEKLKMGVAFAAFTGEVVQKGFVFEKGRGMTFACGSVYAVQESEDGRSAVLSGQSERGPRWLRRWPVEEQIAQWRALEQVEQAKVRTARKTKEERRADAFDEALRPIARAMAATDQAGRRLIKVAVLERLDHLWALGAIS